MQNKNSEPAFRNLLGEQDYPLLLDLNRRSRAGDHHPEPITLETIARVLANMEGLSQEQGVTEAKLGVDAENESAAFRLYERLGYKTFSVDTWFRKAMN